MKLEIELYDAKDLRILADALDQCGFYADRDTPERASESPADVDSTATKQESVPDVEYDTTANDIFDRQPTAPAAPAAPAANVELDSAGNPWDERIHASSKARISDGTWRLKRGVDKNLVAQILGQTNKAPIPTPEPKTLVDEEPAEIPSSDQVTYEYLHQLVLGGLSTMKMTPADVSQVLANNSLRDLNDLKANPQKFNVVHDQLLHLMRQ